MTVAEIAIRLFVACYIIPGVLFYLFAERS